MPRTSTMSTADALAHAIREQILTSDAEQCYLGFEDDLIERFHVSRPTLRQALRILQAEGIVTVKRGVNGGITGRNPDTESVAHVATVYLRSRNATFAHITAAYAMVAVECARLAAANPDEGQRNRLRELAGAPHARDPKTHAAERIQWGITLAEVAANPVMTLFEQALDAMARYPTSAPFLLDPPSIDDTLSAWSAIAGAVAAGDAGLAGEISRRHYDGMARRAAADGITLTGW